MKFLQKFKKTSLIMTIVTATLCAFFIVATVVCNSFAVSINAYFDCMAYKVIKDPAVKDSDRIYFSSEFESAEKFAEYEKHICIKTGEEGSVLLKNENVNGKSALPLAANSKVSLFSRSSIDIIYGGTGSGSVGTNKAPTLKTALESVNISVNQKLWDFYNSSEIEKKYSRSVTDIDGNATKGEYKINEVPASLISATELVASYSEYSDAAIFVMSRGGGEGGDLWMTGTDGENGDYLRLSNEEKDVLKLLADYKKRGIFKEILILINSSNAPHCDFINNAAYSIDGVLWIGGPGQYGLYGVANIIAGKASPSGKLSDTFVYDNLSAPSTVNFGDMKFTNAAEMGLTNSDSRRETNVNYVVYREGIYVGYRYYETRYEDFVLSTKGVGQYDYAKTVAYPFGFGLSYTTFEYESFECKESDDKKSYEVTVAVKNTGDVSSKTVVEVYLQKPYTDYDVKNGVEKPSVELVGFKKTNVIAGGGKEKVTIKIDKSDLKCYDAYGAGTYILEKGSYYLTAATDAHNAINNILLKKGSAADPSRLCGDGNADFAKEIVVDKDDFDTYSVSSVTGEKITNRLSDIDLKLYEGHSDKDSFYYLSRADWTGTYPVKTDITVTEKMKKDIDNEFVTEQGYKMPSYGKNNGVSMIELKGKDYMTPNGTSYWMNLLSTSRSNSFVTLSIKRQVFHR